MEEQSIIVSAPDNDSLQAALEDVAGQLAPTSQRVYRQDAKAFAQWMTEHGALPETLTRQDAIAYRVHLAEKYAKITANRMFSVARRLLDEQVRNKHLPENLFASVEGFKTGNETTHTTLRKEDARELLAAVDRRTVKGKRDYALMSLLVRTGIRRSECAALRLADLRMQEGHHVAIIEHGKGDKRRVVKLPVDVFRSIEQYIRAAGRTNRAPEAALFTGMTKGDKPTEQPISDKLIERVVKHYSQQIDIPTLTPHGLRSTFITLALENKATLHQVQYAAGHADPRTTERYQKRKLNLDDNAVDYIRL